MQTSGAFDGVPLFDRALRAAAWCITGYYRVRYGRGVSRRADKGARWLVACWPDDPEIATAAELYRARWIVRPASAGPEMVYIGQTMAAAGQARVAGYATAADERLARLRAEIVAGVLPL